MELKLKENLRKLLKAKGIKAADLARQSGVAPSVLSEWMSGRMPRNILNLQRIAREFGVSLEELCFSDQDLKGRKIDSRTREIFPLLLPINESGMLEFQVKWTSLKTQEKREEKSG